MEVIHSEATRRGFAARKVDVLYSDTNDISKPWGFLLLASILLWMLGLVVQA